MGKKPDSERYVACPVFSNSTSAPDYMGSYFTEPFPPTWTTADILNQMRFLPGMGERLITYSPGDGWRVIMEEHNIDIGPYMDEGKLLREWKRKVEAIKLAEML